MITAPPYCLLFLLLTYVDGLTANTENQIIALKPILTTQGTTQKP